VHHFAIHNLEKMNYAGLPKRMGVEHVHAIAEILGLSPEEVVPPDMAGKNLCLDRVSVAEVPAESLLEAAYSSVRLIEADPSERAALKDEVESLGDLAARASLRRGVHFTAEDGLTLLKEHYLLGVSKTELAARFKVSTTMISIRMEQACKVLRKQRLIDEQRVPEAFPHDPHAPKPVRRVLTAEEFREACARAEAAKTARRQRRLSFLRQNRPNRIAAKGGPPRNKYHVKPAHEENDKQTIIDALSKGPVRPFLLCEDYGLTSNQAVAALLELRHEKIVWRPDQKTWALVDPVLWAKPRK
jgi:Spy/CpxP family protein refolding chaperone